MKGVLNRLMAFREGIEHGVVNRLVENAVSSNDAKEGIDARMEKRAAKFTGS